MRITSRYRYRSTYVRCCAVENPFSHSSQFIGHSRDLCPIAPTSSVYMVYMRLPMLANSSEGLTGQLNTYMYIVYSAYVIVNRRRETQSTDLTCWWQVWPRHRSTGSLALIDYTSAFVESPVRISLSFSLV